MPRCIVSGDSRAYPTLNPFRCGCQKTPRQTNAPPPRALPIGSAECPTTRAGISSHRLGPPPGVVHCPLLASSAGGVVSNADNAYQARAGAAQMHIIVPTIKKFKQHGPQSRTAPDTRPLWRPRGAGIVWGLPRMYPSRSAGKSFLVNALMYNTPSPPLARSDGRNSKKTAYPSPSRPLKCQSHTAGTSAGCAATPRWRRNSRWDCENLSSDTPGLAGMSPGDLATHRH